MIEYLDEVASTMDVARSRVVAGHWTGDGVAARTQTAGRGQRGRTWYSRPGESLCATYYVHGPDVSPEAAAALGLLAGTAVASTVEQLRQGAPGQLVPVGLKWPNDVLLNGKKVAGVLVELAKASSLEWVALVGVGMNVSNRDIPPELQQTATSLALEGYGTHHWQFVAEGVAQSLGSFTQIWRHAGLPAVVKAWRRYDQTTGRRYRIDAHSGALYGRAESIDADGALTIRLDSGETITTRSATSISDINDP